MRNWKELIAPGAIGISVGLFTIVNEHTGIWRFAIGFVAALLGTHGLRRALREAIERNKTKQ